MAGRHLLTLCAAFCAYILVSCGGSDKKSSLGIEAPDATIAITALTAEEQVALASGDEAALAALFGTPEADRASATPVVLAGGETMEPGASRTASAWDWTKECKQHKKKKCWTCKFKKCNHCDKTSCDHKDDKDKCKNPCKKCDKPDCKDKGDKCKNPCKKCGKPDCKDKGDKCKNPCKRCGKQCKDKGDKCKDNPPPPPCTCKECKIIGIKCDTDMFFEIEDCCDQQADIEYRAQVWFSSGNCTKAGYTVIFKRGDQEVGRAETDASGLATFVEQNVPRGKYDIEVCVDKTQDVEPDHGDCVPCKTDKNKCKWNWKHKAGKGASIAGENPTHNDGDPNNDQDGRDDDPDDGNAGGGNDEVDDDANLLCCEGQVVVYHQCVRGIITGKGPIEVPCINADGTHSEPHGVAMFNYRISYQDGNLGGTFSYSDPHNGVTIANEAPTWIVVLGTEVWFGTDDWMVHMADAGLPKPKPGDQFHIWIWDKPGYAIDHTHGIGGDVLNCYVRNSFAWTFKCP